MAKSAADGTIDFKESNPRDRNWRIKLELLLKQVIDRDSLKYLKFLQLRHILYLGANISKEGWEQHHKWELDAFADFSRLFLNLPADDTTREEQVAKALEGAWQRAFGNLNEPETKSNIDAVAEALRRQREQGKEAERGIRASNAIQSSFGNGPPVQR